VLILNLRTAAYKVYDNFCTSGAILRQILHDFGVMYLEEKTEVLGFNTVQAAGVVPNFSGQILGILFSDHCQF